MLVTVKYIVLFLCALLMVYANAETIYKTRDQNGNIVFSDKPSKNAEEIHVTKPQVIEAKKLGKFVYKLKPKVAPIDYELRITKPAPDAVIRENAGNMEIAVMVSTAVQSPHKVQLKMDGKLLAGKPPVYILSNVDRGGHTLVAELVDGEGHVLHKSTAVQFTILRQFVRR